MPLHLFNNFGIGLRFTRLPAGGNGVIGPEYEYDMYGKDSLQRLVKDNNRRLCHDGKQWSTLK